MSVSKFLYHIVLRTRFSAKAFPFEYEREIYTFLYNECVQSDCIVHRIGGMPDHVHILLYIPPKIAVSDFIKNLKAHSSNWITNNNHFPDFRGWGREYAAFTYAYSQRDTIVNYIKNQKEHHRIKSFKEELATILGECGEADKLVYLLRD